MQRINDEAATPPGSTTTAVKRAQANAAALSRKPLAADDIASFPVPDTREDLWEFALMATGKIKTNAYGFEGWCALLEQILLKAQTTYRDDCEGLERFRPLIAAMELKKIEKQHRKVKIIIILLLIFFVFPILGGLLAWVLTQ